MGLQQISNTFAVTVDGTPLPDTVSVDSVLVEDHLHTPDSFMVILRDPAASALSDTGATIGAAVEISVVSDATTTPEVLLSGEITAVEARIAAGHTSVVIRGFDQSNRLFRGCTTASYRDMTYADAANQVAQRAGLHVGEIESTRPSHTHIGQANESDWSFLSRLANEVGFEVTVSDGALNFHAPATSDSAPGSSDLASDDPLTLNAGSNLTYLQATVTAADQVKDVEVRSWDPLRKETLTATVQAATTSATNGQRPSDLAATFGDRSLVATGTPYATAHEVEAAAKALVDEVASSFTEVEAQSPGNPKLRAGTAVQIGLLGEPFDGKYVITSSEHRYDSDEGYVTNLVMSGRQERSTFRLAGGDTQRRQRIGGVVPAIVDDNNDPEELCRVRLRFPWMDESYVSDWSRVVHAGAGAKRGFVLLPEVGDEVLAAFEQGDVRRPYVLGGLYSTVDTPDVGPAPLLDASSHAVNNRLFTSRLGHRLIFIDGDTETGVVVSTADGKHVVRLDQANQKVDVMSAGEVSVATGSGNVVVSSGAEVTVEASTNITVKGGANVSVEATGSLELKGQTIKIEGSGPVQISGAQVLLN